MKPLVSGESSRSWILGSQDLAREQAIKLWAQKLQAGWQACEPQWLPPPAPAER